MTKGESTKRYLLSGLCWASLVMLLVAVVILVLASSRLVQARVQTTEQPERYTHLWPSQTFSSTVFLPAILLPCYSPAKLTISGPMTDTVGLPQTFTAMVAPSNAELPISYSWQATGQAPLDHDGGLSDAATFTWTTAGQQSILVEATNQCGQVVSDTWTYNATYKNMIAYERRSAGAETHDIFLMYQDGSMVENLTNSPDSDDGTPTWSPDGYQIAFTSRPDGGNGAPRILKIDLRTRVVTQLTDGTYNDRYPTWSPDGTKIAFMRRIPPKQIWVMNADGSNQQNLTNSGYSDEWPAWSWDGDWIVFVSNRFEIDGDYMGRDLWIVNVDNPSDQRNVLRTDKQPGIPPEPTFPNEELYPTWAPDGMIYYSYAPTAEEPQQLYRIWPDGSGRAKVFPGDTYERTIASFQPPDGQCMVFYGYLGQGDKEVWKWCDGYSTPDNLTNNVDIDDEFCVWSPVP